MDRGKSEVTGGVGGAGVSGRVTVEGDDVVAGGVVAGRGILSDAGVEVTGEIVINGAVTERASYGTGGEDSEGGRVGSCNSEVVPSPRASSTALLN